MSFMYVFRVLLILLKFFPWKLKNGAFSPYIAGEVPRGFGGGKHWETLGFFVGGTLRHPGILGGWAPRT